MEHVDHAGAHQARIPAGAENAERQRRQDELRERAVAAHREPVEVNGEDIEEQDPHQELRGRGEDEGGDHQPLVEAAAAPERCEEAHGEPDHDLEEDRAGDEEGGRRQARPDERRHLRLLQVGAAEVTLQEAAEVTEILLVKRPIEAELAPHLCDLLRSGHGTADHHLRRVGRDHVEEQEGDERYPDQDQDRLPEAAKDIEGHQ